MANPGPVLRTHYNAMLKKNGNLRECFPAPPMPVLRQAKNLRRILCRARLPPVKRLDRVRRGTHKDAPGWKSCRNPCHICPFTLPNCDRVIGNNGFEHTIVRPLTCETQNCVYYWKCTKPNCSTFPECEYIGMTARTFRERLAEHKDI